MLKSQSTRSRRLLVRMESYVGYAAAAGAAAGVAVGRIGLRGEVTMVSVLQR
jgi:hypothetical protein